MLDIYPSGICAGQIAQQLFILRRIFVRIFFENFELTLDWKIAKGANSGIFYRLDESAAEPEMWTAAPEYQVIDDRGYPAPLKPTQKTAANYDLQPPGRDATKPAGEWNTTRIVANGSHVEHWLNGQLIVQYELWTDEWKKLVEQSGGSVCVESEPGAGARFRFSIPKLPGAR